MVFNHNFVDTSYNIIICHHKDVSIVPSTFYVLLIINLPQSLYINKKKTLSCTTPETDARNRTAHKIISVITCRDGRTLEAHPRPLDSRHGRTSARCTLQ